MNFREQKKLLSELKDFERKMSLSDLEAYKLFIKRDKDDDELDTLSIKRLKELHQKYYVPKAKPDISKYFKSQP